MPGFAHLCPECLDIPTAQCGYRGCPQRALQTSAVPAPRPPQPQGAGGYGAQATAASVPVVPLQASASHREGALMADATRAVTLPAGALPPAQAPSVTAATAAYTSLPAAADALATRFVDPAALPKTSAMPSPLVPEPPPRRPAQPAAEHGKDQP